MSFSHSFFMHMMQGFWFLDGLVFGKHGDPCMQFWLNPNHKVMSPTRAFFVKKKWWVSNTSGETRTRPDVLQVYLKLNKIVFSCKMSSDISIFWPTVSLDSSVALSSTLLVLWTLIHVLQTSVSVTISIIFLKKKWYILYFI